MSFSNCKFCESFLHTMPLIFVKSFLVGERAKQARHYRGVTNGNRRYIYKYVYVIARVGVKFWKIFTSVRLSGNKITRGEAECYFIATQPNTSEICPGNFTTNRAIKD